RAGATGPPVASDGRSGESTGRLAGSGSVAQEANKRRADGSRGGSTALCVGRMTSLTLPDMTSQPLDVELLRAEQRRLFLAARAGISAPAAGAIYWLALGVAGFYLRPNAWCLLAFITSGAIFPLAIALQKPLRANMFVKSPLDSMTFPTLLPVMLCFGFSIPAF